MEGKTFNLRNGVSMVQGSPAQSRNSVGGTQPCRVSERAGKGDGQSKQAYSWAEVRRVLSSSSQWRFSAGRGIP